MATKAERFRYESERSKPKRPPRPAPRPKRRATRDRGARNLSGRAGKKAPVVTEETRAGRPSRKASRRSAHHGKNSAVLEYVARLESMQPKVHHAKR